MYIGYFLGGFVNVFLVCEEDITLYFHLGYGPHPDEALLCG